jgi:hypothetical protein
MRKTISRISSPLLHVWKRFIDLLDARAQREVNAWGASLEYRRAYTNPDIAKRYRNKP